jgi:CheY-like chemotaxis protein
MMFGTATLSGGTLAMTHEPIDPIEILLVEDNEDDIILTEEAFAVARVMNSINSVRDGEAALAYLRQEGPYKDAVRPGLVLLDINMPKKNGFEVLEAIKADPRLQALPVIMLTTSEREEDIVRSYTYGASSYVRKPVSLERFIDVVRKFELYWTLISLVPGRRG